jgi:hypothetical protein
MAADPPTSRPVARRVTLRTFAFTVIAGLALAGLGLALTGLGMACFFVLLLGAMGSSGSNK